MNASACPIVPNTNAGTVGQKPDDRKSCGAIDLKALATRILAGKSAEKAMGQSVGQAILFCPTPSPAVTDEARYAFKRLLWCLDAYRAEGLRLHFYAVSPKPEFAMVYPEAFTPPERIMVQDYFLGAVDLIAEHAPELAKGRVSQNWRRAA